MKHVAHAVFVNMMGRHPQWHLLWSNGLSPELCYDASNRKCTHSIGKRNRKTRSGLVLEQLHIRDILNPKCLKTVFGWDYQLVVFQIYTAYVRIGFELDIELIMMI